MWTSPLTWEWDDVLDVLPVARLGELYLVLQAASEPSAALLAQMQRLESELGLSPAARKRMHVKAEQTWPQDASDDGSSIRDRLTITGAATGSRSRRLRATDPS